MLLLLILSNKVPSVHVQGGALQLLAAKLGVATGQHLAQHCR